MFNFFTFTSVNETQTDVSNADQTVYSFPIVNL